MLLAWRCAVWGAGLHGSPRPSKQRPPTVHVLNGNNLLAGLVQRSCFSTPDRFVAAHRSPLEPLNALQLKSVVCLAGQRRALLIPWLLQSPINPLRDGVESPLASSLGPFHWSGDAAEMPGGGH